jgi:hypothetical protein
MTPIELKKFQKLAVSYKTMKAPDGITPLADFMVIKPEDLALKLDMPMPEATAVLDKTMLHSSLNTFDRKYVDHVLHKDYANAVMSLQNAGVAVTNYKIEKQHDILGGYEDHTLKLQPIVGQPSTLRFKLPIVNSDGTYTAGGVKYRLRKQRGDLPIRKIANNKVALTSYYGKTFVTRARKASDDYGQWLLTQVTAKASDRDNLDIVQAVYSDVFNQTLICAREYSAIGKGIKSFLCKGFSFNFDRKEVLATYPPALLKKFEKQHTVFVAIEANQSSYLMLNVDGYLTRVSADGASVKPLEHITDFLGIESRSAPIESISAGIFGKDIPVAVIMALQMGLEKLLVLLKVDPVRIPAGEKYQLKHNEYAIRFNDETLVFDKTNRLATLLLAGFNEYEKQLRLFSVYSFDKRGVYVNLLESAGIGVRYVREIDLADSMFVDPITRDILIELKEPTTYLGLLLKAAEMLLVDAHPDELDPASMRIKGYERMSGAVYSELVQSVRAHNGSLGKANTSIQLNPYAIWKKISEDPVKIQVSEMNPIATLKESEAVTYGGVGGRSSLSMTKRTRGYHRNDMGTISEATVDSSDTGINVFTSADPKFTSVRGVSKRFNLEKPNITNLLSTSALLSPCSDTDDPRRTAFVSIQQTHAVACDGYHQLMVRTGYDAVIAHRLDEPYAYTAKQPGVVSNVTPTGIIVDYDNKERQGFQLGRTYGNAQGLTVAHSVVTPLKVGDRFEVGDPIIYNEGFFEPDFFNPKQICWKNAVNVRTVLWEASATHEDSSSISTTLASKLSTKITKVKTIVLRFDQAIGNMVEVGTHVTADSTLCVIQDSFTANSKLFDEKSLDTLKMLSAQAPRAGTRGVVERIEVYYHGQKEDMSDSIAAIANKSDKEIHARAISAGKPVHTGKVDSGFRIEGNPLNLDTLAIKVYITHDVGAGVGDKAVFGNQLKSVVGDVMESPMFSEDNREIDAQFGAKSVEARIVNSPAKIGTTATLLKLIGQNASKIYKGEHVA